MIPIAFNAAITPWRRAKVASAIGNWPRVGAYGRRVESPPAYTSLADVSRYSLVITKPRSVNSNSPFNHEASGRTPTDIITVSASYSPLSVTTDVTFPFSPLNERTFSPPWTLRLCFAPSLVKISVSSWSRYVFRILGAKSTIVTSIPCFA